MSRFREEIAGQVSEPLRSALRCAPENTRDIRVRIGRYPVCFAGGAEGVFARHIYTREDCERLLDAVCAHSLYARQEDVARGFVTLRGGHRVGVLGTAVMEHGQVLRQSRVGFFNIRVAREVPGCADILLPKLNQKGLFRSTLIVSPPGLGKTTMLRDVVRQLSMAGAHIALIDERSELAANHMGQPQLDIGPSTDVLDGCPRAVAIPMLVRSMSPDIIALDEINRFDEVDALCDAAASGCAVIATAHADSLDGLRRRKPLVTLLESGLIGRVAVLADRPGQVREVREL